MGRSSIVYAADFETTTKANLEQDGRVRVWLWSLVNVNGTEEYHGNNIESFMWYIQYLQIDKIWFYNLRFDGSFILWHLLYETD